MQHPHQVHHAGSSGKKITWIIVAVIVVVLAVVLIVTQMRKTGFNPVFISFENYDSIYKGEIQDDGVVLNDAGYVSMDLSSGGHILYYKLKECANPSENFNYSRTDSDGNQVYYDPLKEKLVVNAGGGFDRIAFSESEKLKALIDEKVYVLETESTDPIHSLAILDDGALNFKAKGDVKFLYKAKCDGSQVSLSLYKVN